MYHSHRYQLLDLLFDDAVTAFHAIGTVGGKLQLQGKQQELVGEPLHMRVFLFRHIEHQASFTVGRFQIGLDTGCLVCLLLFIRKNRYCLLYTSDAADD